MKQRKEPERKARRKTTGEDSEKMDSSIDLSRQKARGAQEAGGSNSQGCFSNQRVLPAYLGHSRKN
jgi:hypothetical protein